MQDPIDRLHDASASLSGRFEQELAAHRERLAAQYPESTSHCWRTLGLVGAGVMGTAIAATALRHGLAVMATDVSEALLTSMADRVAASFSVPAPGEAGGVHNGSEALARLQTTARLADLAAADLVIESVIEDPAVKGSLYLAVEPHLAAGTLLASNTSTVRIGLLSQRLSSPGRFCGLHFFYPVHDRPLVEVIAGPQTAPATVAAAVDFARRIGKIPLPVGDGCGFVVNRLLQAYLGEALQLLMEGVSPQDVDQAAEQFGMACGPLRMLDEIGLDTALHCAWIFAGAFPQIVPITPLLVAMVKARRLGRKSGAGFYAYDNTRPDAAGRYDPQTGSVLTRWAGPSRTRPADEIVRRLILPMVLEATRLLSEGIAQHPRDVDLGIVLGLGFPRARGGLLLWADQLGAARLVEELRPMEGLGYRLQPTPLLLNLAAQKQTFYSCQRHSSLNS